MATTHEIPAETRKDEGKGASRHLRRAGKVPAIVYGAHVEPKSIQLHHNTVYLATQHEWFYSAILDLNLHQMAKMPADFDDTAWEKAQLTALGVPTAVGMRHRLPHFSHIFDGGYSAGYYAYTWAEAMDADGFEAFKESGDVFKTYDNRPLSPGLRFEERQQPGLLLAGWNHRWGPGANTLFLQRPNGALAR